MSSFKPFHPAVPVTAGFVFILLLQRLEGLALAAAVALCAAAALVRARTLWWRLLRRLRYMLLVLVVLFAWQTPGVLAWPHAGAWSPTVDGLALAGGHAGRIVLVVSVVALMLQGLSHAAWVQGLYGLLAPLARLGFPAERFALRLQLVLQDAGGERIAWREALAPQAAPREAAPPLRLTPPVRRDGVAILFLLALAVGGLA